MKEPTKSVKAVLLPSWMAPKAVQRTAENMISKRRIKGQVEAITAEYSCRNRTAQSFVDLREIAREGGSIVPS